jgi:hypothetical protein
MALHSGAVFNPIFRFRPAADPGAIEARKFTLLISLHQPNPRRETRDLVNAEPENPALTSTVRRPRRFLAEPVFMHVATEFADLRLDLWPAMALSIG